MDLQFGHGSTWFRKYFWPNIRFLSCFASVLVVYSAGVSSDECLNATDIGDTDRRNESTRLPAYGPQALCDADFDTNLWYYFGLDNRRCRMTENCPLYGHCGTVDGIWLNGSHPTANDTDPVQRTVCSRNGHLDNCCEWSDTISIKWCWNAETEREYFVYKLARVSECYMAYCISSDCGEEPIMAKTRDPYETTTPPFEAAGNLYPPMTDPVLNPPFVTGTKKVLDKNGNQVEVQGIGINCTIGYTQTTIDDGAKFVVDFYVDNDLLVQYFTYSPYTLVPTHEGLLDGYIGRNITCQVYSYWSYSQDVMSPTLTSNAYQLPSPASTTSDWATTTTSQPSIPLFDILLGVLIPVAVIVIVVIIVVCVACKRNCCKKKTTKTNFERAIALDNYQELQKASSGGGGDENYDKIADPIDGQNAYDDQIVWTTREENKYDYLDLGSELAKDTQSAVDKRKAARSIYP